MDQYLPAQKSEELMNDIRDYMQALKDVNGNAIRSMKASGFFFLSRGIDRQRANITAYIPFGTHSIEFQKEMESQVKTILQEQFGYSTILADKPVHLVTNSKNIVATLHIGSSPTQVDFFFVGDSKVIEQINDVVTEHLDRHKPPVVRRVIINGGGDLMSRREILPERDPIQDIHALYPSFDVTPQTLWEAFQNSKSNVVLLIGPPGTGKSSFIMEMLRARGWDKKTYIVDKDSVLKHEFLTDYIRELPQGSVMVTEDADQLVAKRENGNSGMAGLLNATAGIIPTDTKIIISTNLANLKNVDEALLRPGRAFRVLNFKPLSIEEAYRVREVMGLEYVEFSSDYKTLTLSEAINYTEIDDTARQGRTIGF